MRLEDFPRPKDDNGRGVHWSAWPYHALGPGLDFWIAELQAMKLKWVKLLDDGGSSSLEICRRLLEADIMPIVRIYRGPPNPGHIGGREEEALAHLVSAGVRYFETNNEPDLPGEWQGGHMPENWLDIVVDGFIYDADRILALGGFPALPAMSPGKRHDALALVVRKNRADLFQRGAWIAIHNYTLNHPLNYPYDPVNVQGQPLTQEEYDAFLREEVVPEGSSFAWDNQPMELINQWRASDKNTAASLERDFSCFLAYILANTAAETTLGFSVPVISTEGGPVANWRDDRRYPRVTPRLHGDWTVRLFQFMQDQAPPWYFAICPWLLASYRLGDYNPSWEQMSWYTNWYDRRFGLRGEMPVVAALKALPSRPRVISGGTAALQGTARSQAHKPINDLSLALRQNDRDVVSATTGTDGTFAFTRLVAGTYDLALPDRIACQGIVLAEGETKALELTLTDGQHSAIRGLVCDVNQTPQPGATVELRRGETLLKTATTAADGHFAMTGLGEGTYRLETRGAPVADIVLDGWDARSVDLVVLAAVGYRYHLIAKHLLTREETANRNAFFGHVLDANGNGVNGICLRMTWSGADADTRFPETTSGQDPYQSPGNYAFIHTAGDFQVQVVQGDWPSDLADGLVTVDIPGRANEPIAYEVNWQLQPVAATEPRQSRVEGEVPGGQEGQRLTLRCASTRWTTTLSPVCRFAFADLGAGTYILEIEGIGTVETAILLDGSNDHLLTLPLQSRITGKVLGGTTGATVTLASETWSWTRETTLGADGCYLFSGLPWGTYTANVEGREVRDLQVDGRNPVSAPDIELSSGWQSVIRGHLVDEQGIPQPGRRLRLYQNGVLLAQMVTDTEGRATFTGLGLGTHGVDVEGVIMDRSQITLDGKEEKTMEIHLPSAALSQPITHYVLLGPAEAVGTRVALLLAQPYLRKSGAMAGFSAQEAARSTRVTIVGDSVAREDQARLVEAGCQVEQLSGDAYALAQALARLMGE